MKTPQGIAKAASLLALAAAACGGSPPVVKNPDCNTPLCAVKKVAGTLGYAPLSVPQSQAAFDVGIYFQDEQSQIVRSNILTLCNIGFLKAELVTTSGSLEKYSALEEQRYSVPFKLQAGLKSFGIPVELKATRELAAAKRAEVRFSDIAVTRLDIDRTELQLSTTKNAQDQTCREYAQLPSRLPVAVEVLTAKPAVSIVSEGGEKVELEASALDTGSIGYETSSARVESGEVRATQPVVLGYKIADVLLFRPAISLGPSPDVVTVGTKPYDLTAVQVTGQRLERVLRQSRTPVGVKDVFEYQTWVYLPEDLYLYVKEVKYDLHHPTNPYPANTSTKPERFVVSNHQWGCIRNGLITITFKAYGANGEPLAWQKPYDQCALLGL